VSEEEGALQRSTGGWAGERQKAAGAVARALRAVSGSCQGASLARVRERSPPIPSDAPGSAEKGCFASRWSPRCDADENWRGVRRLMTPADKAAERDGSGARPRGREKKRKGRGNCRTRTNSHELKVAHADALRCKGALGNDPSRRVAMDRWPCR
jgi:hypothetical protein